MFKEFVILGHVPHCLSFSYVAFDFGFVVSECKFKNCYHFSCFVCECVSYLLAFNAHIARNLCQDHCFAKIY